jgi:hypothetical protein
VIDNIGNGGEAAYADQFDIDAFAAKSVQQNIAVRRIPKLARTHKHFFVHVQRRNRFQQIVLRFGLRSIRLDTGVTGIEYPVRSDQIHQAHPLKMTVRSKLKSR